MIPIKDINGILHYGFLSRPVDIDFNSTLHSGLISGFKLPQCFSGSIMMELLAVSLRTQSNRASGIIGTRTGHRQESNRISKCSKSHKTLRGAKFTKNKNDQWRSAAHVSASRCTNPWYVTHPVLPFTIREARQVCLNCAGL